MSGHKCAINQSHYKYRKRSQCQADVNEKKIDSSTSPFLVSFNAGFTQCVSLALVNEVKADVVLKMISKHTNDRYIDPKMHTLHSSWHRIPQTERKQTC